MKFLTLFILLSIGATLKAQNWQVVPSSKMYHYQEQQDSWYSCSIVIDSSKIIANDTISYLNLVCSDIISDFSELHFLFNLPQFLNAKIIENTESYSFVAPDTFIIMKNKNLGEGWTFSISDSAYISSYDTSTILNEIDSIKTILLIPSNKKIIISKNHGIVYFENYKDTTIYSLIGIQGNINGFNLPTYKEIYNYQAGDIMCYSYADHVIPYYEYYKTKFHTKVSTDSSDIYYITHYSDSSYVVPPSTDLSHNFYVYEDTIEFSHNSFPYLKPQKSLVNNKILMYEKDSTNAVFIKSYPGFGNPIISSNQITYSAIPGEPIQDSVYKINYGLWHDEDGRHGLGQHLGSGNLVGYHGSLEYGNACKEDGEFLHINSNKPLNITASIYPTIVHDILQIHFETNSYNITIYNLQGNAVYTNKYINTMDYHVNISELVGGLYFVLLNDSNGHCIQQKIIKD